MADMLKSVMAAIGLAEDDARIFAVGHARMDRTRLHEVRDHLQRLPRPDLIRRVLEN